MLKGFTNIGSVLRQAQEMGGQLNEMNAQLKTQRVVGSAGGGLVETEFNGQGEMLRLTIDPTLVERNEREMLEDLIPAAVNQGISKAKQLHADAMKSMTAGIEIPGLDEAMSKLTEQQ